MEFNTLNTSGIPFWIGLLSIVYLIFVLGLLFFLLFRFTFSDEPGKNPYKGETLGLPRGTMRAILTMTLLFYMIVFQIYALFYLESDLRISTFIGAFEIMLAFYFGSKVMHHLSSTDKYKSRDIALALKGKKSEFDEPDSVG